MELAARIHSALNTDYFRWDIYQLSEPTSFEAFIKPRLQLPPGQRWQELIEFAGLYVNGKEHALAALLPSPARLEVYVPKNSVAQCIAEYNAFVPQTDIVFDREGIVVAFKPARLHTMPAREQRQFSLKKALTEYYGTDIHMPSRLDFSTSGLVLTSRSGATHDFAQQLYQQRQIKKAYLLATATKPDFESRTVVTPIGQDPRHAVLRKVVSKGGKSARTHFVYLEERTPGTHVILAIPETGRTHQIRVHAASLGVPILGDKFYGGAAADSLHLICGYLLFPLPESVDLAEVLAPDSHLPDWAQNLQTRIRTIARSS